MLDISGSTILWEMINFLIVALILNFLVFKPIVKKSEKRAAEKAYLLEQMHADQKEAAAQLKNINTRLAHFESELQQIADEEYDYNRGLQTELLDATREEADRILQDAVVEARKQYLVDLKNHQTNLVDTVIQLSADAIRKAIPEEVHPHMIEALTQKIWDLGKTDMRQVNKIRESLSGETPSIRAQSAFPLTLEQKGSLVRTFSALADGDIHFELEENEDLIAGVKVWIGDLLIENTIQGRLNSAHGDVVRSLEQIYMDDNGDE